MAGSNSLRRAALRGGAYLAGRQIFSVAVKIVIVTVVTRTLTPAEYGAYVWALNIYQYAVALGTAGIGIWLLRQPEAVFESALSTAYALLLATSIVLWLVLQGVRMGFGEVSDVDGLAAMTTVVAFALPFQFLAIPAAIRLERGLRYRAVVTGEMAGQVCSCVVTLLLLVLGFGPMALTIAWVVQQVVACILLHGLGRTVPKPGFDTALAQSLIGYAASFSAANWIWQLRLLVNPLIVGPALGVQAVGLIGLTVGILETLSVIKAIGWRVSAAVLARVRHDATRLRQAVTEGMELQTLAVGAILLGFGWSGNVIVPVVFGENWTGMMEIYPCLAIAYLTISTFSTHSALLSVLDRNRSLAAALAVHVALFAGVAAIAVPAAGAIGYGYAEIAALPAYLLVHRAVSRAVGAPAWRVAAIWWAATAIGLLWSQLGLWAIAVPFLTLALPASTKRLSAYLGAIRLEGAVS